MVGRKVTTEELEDEFGLITHEEKFNHLQTEIFQESNEQFSQAVVKNEGVLSHYMRHFYLVLGLGVAITGGLKIIGFTYEFNIYFEDAQDHAMFEYVKAMANMEQREKHFADSDKPGQFWIELQGAPGQRSQSHPGVQYLMRTLYKSDLYSVEGRSS